MFPDSIARAKAETSGWMSDGVAAFGAGAGAVSLGVSATRCTTTGAGGGDVTTGCWTGLFCAGGWLTGADTTDD